QYRGEPERRDVGGRSRNPVPLPRGARRRRGDHSRPDGRLLSQAQRSLQRPPHRAAARQGRPRDHRGAGDRVHQAVAMLVAFSVSPSGAGDTGGVGAAVAEAIRIVRASGLSNETNAMFTNIEGEWDEVMAVVKRAVEAVAAASPRVSLVLKADIRPGYTGQLTAKVARIERELQA